jgi:two-component system chemotaxis response regulator CheY
MAIHSYSNILVVDDSGAIRGVVRKLLAQLGYKNIDEASDGASALDKILGKHFDLVISDWNMEPMNGEELLTQVRANEKYKYLPFIMMTADRAIEKIVQAKQARVSCFINKPFRAEGLQAKISEINKAP